MAEGFLRWKLGSRLGMQSFATEGTPSVILEHFSKTKEALFIDQELNNSYNIWVLKRRHFISTFFKQRSYK